MSETDSRQTSPYVQVGQYCWESHALEAKLALESQGIEVIIENRGIIDANPLLANATGGIKIKVRKEDEEKAREILKKAFKENMEERGKRCPKCGSENIVEKRLNPLILLLSVVTLGLYFLAFYWPYRCRKCGYCWR